MLRISYLQADLELCSWLSSHFKDAMMRMDTKAFQVGNLFMIDTRNDNMDTIVWGYGAVMVLSACL